MSLRECTGEECLANPGAIASLTDGGRVGLATALDQSELRVLRLLQQVQFLSEVLAEIHELTEPKSTRPLNDLSLIRIKTTVAIRAVKKSGRLP